MDSLLASYASSDEEDEEQKHPHQHQPQQHQQQTNPSKPSSSLFSSLPPTKSSSSSLFNSLPPPKSNPSNPPPQTLIKNPHSPKPTNQFAEADQPRHQEDDPQPKSSSLFSFLPPPKTHDSDSKPVQNPPSLSLPKPKKIVQFKPPINASFFKSHDVDSEDEDDKEEKERKRSKVFAETATVKSFLSSIPAPKNSASLGSLPSSGSGRRSIIDAEVQGSTYNEVKAENEVNEVGVDSNAGNYEGQWVDDGSYSTPAMEAPAASLDYAVGCGDGDPSCWPQTNEHAVYDESNGYGSYANYGQYESKWVDRSVANGAQDVSGMAESVIKIPGKRGRNEIPQDMIEVKQEELIKNRPREDQVKLTGIAFGPSYQPTPSTKGKPTKLHKRKHQIGSLYFDMRQKEMELAERRSKGFLTKAETQAKYGW